MALRLAMLLTVAFLPIHAMAQTLAAPPSVLGNPAEAYGSSPYGTDENSGGPSYYLKSETSNAYPQRPEATTHAGTVQFEVSRQIAAESAAGCACDCACDCGGPCRKGPGCPHPWRTGPGWCDDWCVGPHWRVSLDGLFLRRDGIDQGDLENRFGVASNSVEEFGYEAGARMYVTGEGFRGYDVQVGYVGVDRWRAYADFTVPAVGARDVEYRTGFHSGEINIFPDRDSPWRYYGGVRYFELGEDFYVRDLALDLAESTHVENKMIGFQLGMRRDLWNFSNWAYVEAMVNGGVYRNRIKRFDRSGTITAGTSIIDRDEHNEVAFLGEAAIAAVLKINQCLAVRGGYQILGVDGVTLAQDAFFRQSEITGSVFYHGGFVGIEYRR